MGVDILIAFICVDDTATDFENMQRCRRLTRGFTWGSWTHLRALTVCHPMSRT